jgi:hypothetical protein
MAWKRERRKCVDWKHSDLEHLGAGSWSRTVGETSPVGDPDHARRICLGDVIHADQRRQLDGRVDLLHALPYRRIGWVLVIVDEPAR